MLLPFEPADAPVQNNNTYGATFLSLPWEIRTIIYEYVFAGFYAMDVNQHVLEGERYDRELEAKCAKDNILEASPQLEEDINYQFYSRSTFCINLKWSSFNSFWHPKINGPMAAWRPDDHLIQNLSMRVQLPVSAGSSCEYLKKLFVGYEDTTWNPASGESTLRRIQPRLATLKKLRLRITSEDRRAHDTYTQIVSPRSDKQVRARVPKLYGATYDEFCLGLSYPDTAKIFGTERELMKLFRSYLGRQDRIVIEIQYLAYNYHNTAFYPFAPSWSTELYGDVVFDGVAADFWAIVEDSMEQTSPRYHNDASQTMESDPRSPGLSVHRYKARSILGAEVSADSERLYFVHWIGSYGLDKLAWESESVMLETAPKLLKRYKYAVLYNESNVRLGSRGQGKRRERRDCIKNYQLCNNCNDL